MKTSTRKPLIAHILLAAGASTRMGEPKQLLPWQGQSLIRHAIGTVLSANITQKLIVVLGAKQDLILPELNDLPVEIVLNPDWAEGMGSTIRAGLTYLLEKEEAPWAGISISLTDQPLVTAGHFKSLYRLWVDSPYPIAAASYHEVLGVPAIFGQRIFPSLLALQGAAGARKILMQEKAQVAPLELPEAQFDLDTPEDYERLKPGA